MKQEFVTYEQATMIKNFGFDEPCFANFYTVDKELIPYRGYPNEGNEDSHFSTTKNSGLSNVWVSAPLKQQVISWFIDTHKLRPFIGWRPNVKKWDCHIVDLTLNGSEYVKGRKFEDFKKDPVFDTYEECVSFCIDKLIENLLNKEK